MQRGFTCAEFCRFDPFSGSDLELTRVGDVPISVSIHAHLLIGESLSRFGLDAERLTGISAASPRLLWANWCDARQNLSRCFLPSLRCGQAAVDDVFHPGDIR